MDATKHEPNPMREYFYSEKDIVEIDLDEMVSHMVSRFPHFSDVEAIACLVQTYLISKL